MKELIRTILKESTFFRRRIDMRLMEKEFFETLNFATDMFLKRSYVGIDFTFKEFKRRVIDFLMDDYHDVLSNGGSNDFPYDEVYDFLSNHFHDKIKERYDLILNRNINESVPSQVKRRQQIFDDMFLAKRNGYISCNYRTPEYLFNGLLELTLEELYFGWFVDSVTYEEWEESVKYIENYLTEKYYDETSRMWESKCKGRLYESEDNEGLYLSMIKDIVDPYKTENGVCDIDVNYDQEDDMYTVMVNFGLKQLDKTFHPVRSLQREWHVEDIRNKVKNEILGLLPIENIYVGSTAVENCNEKINESKILDKVKSFLGKKPLTKDDKLIDIIVKFIEENYSIDFESDEEGDITFYLTNDTGNWIFPPIMKYFPTKKLLNYNWKFAEDIHTWIGDDRLLQPDSEMMGKIFEKLFNKKVNKVFGFSRL